MLADSIAELVSPTPYRHLIRFHILDPCREAQLTLGYCSCYVSGETLCRTRPSCRYTHDALGLGIFVTLLTAAAVAYRLYSCTHIYLPLTESPDRALHRSFGPIVVAILPCRYVAPNQSWRIRLDFNCFNLGFPKAQRYV